MLSSRDFVYHSEMTAGAIHGFHRHCDCVIVPGFLDSDGTLGVQVEGYDPDAMRQRWYECADAVGVDVHKEYSSTKDLQKVFKEIDTHDYRWLNTRTEFKPSVEEGASPDDYEKKVGSILSEQGFKVAFLAPTGNTVNGYKARTPDTTLNGIAWEIKNPSGSGKLTVRNQFKSAVYGNDTHDRNPQSSNLVISNVRSEMTIEKMEADVNAVFASGEYPEITEVLLVDRSGSIRRLAA